MATRIRTLNFLPEIFKTTTNSQFLQATLDQLVAQPNTTRIEGYIGSKFGYGINANDKYVIEPNKVRTDYQLEPGVVFTKANDTTAQDFISYPGILDALKLEGALTNNNNRLFNSQFYSWDSFTDLDKIINFNQYYWLPEGPERVTISTEIVFNTSNYVVNDIVNGYLITSETQPVGTINPTLTLLRGGTYTFSVNQASQFWIQGVPGITGYDPTQPNVQTRDVLGVTNNGATTGVVTFTVPPKNAQNEYNFPGNNTVDVVSNLPFVEVNGARVNDIGGIDGITSLEGLTVMFYDNGVPYEQGFVSKFYDQTTYDQDGGVAYDEETDYPGSTLDYNNFEGGFYTDVSGTFYTITYVGDPLNPTIQLIPAGSIPTNEKITALYGTEWIGRNFYRNISGAISLIPYNSAILDTLYYQDGTVANKVGIIKLVDSNVTNRLDVVTEILGRPQYTSSTGVVFTNGLKVVFQGDVYPESYKNVEYYVEGVGTAIELIPVQSLVSPGLFTEGAYIPFDTTPYDIGNYDSSLYVPVTPDYITIARNAINKNAWSRSNRWFHIDVIQASATYNNNPSLVTEYATLENKAKRPIIEFYANLRLFNSGVVGKDPIDFIDFRTTDAFSQVAGQTNYYPDVAGWTSSNATIYPVTGASTTVTATETLALVNQVVLSSTTGLYVNDTIAFTSTPFDGNIVEDQVYYITSIDYDADKITISTERQGATLVLEGGTGSMTTSIYPYTTKIEVPTVDVFGSFQTGLYVTDSADVLPTNSTVSNVEIDGDNTIIYVSWYSLSAVPSTTNINVVTTDTTADNYALFDGCRVVFAADTTLSVRSKIYTVHFNSITGTSVPVITLTEAEDGEVLADEQTAVYRGYNYQGDDFYFDGLNWFQGQQKETVNQAPKFDVFDNNGVSFGDSTVYVGSSFTGSTLFQYGIGAGLNDSILGFPVRYSSVDNVGDISFDVTLNSQTFNYVQGSTPITQNVNTGYVYNYTSRTLFDRQLGWQTAVSPSIQYQVFDIEYDIDEPTTTFTCDIAPVATSTTNWPVIQVYINNVIQTVVPYDEIETSTYDCYYTTTDDTTTVTFASTVSDINTVVQILILSDQVSTTAYYQVPVNLNNNPLNADVLTVNVGDIRGQYQSAFYNNPNSSGVVFGANNYRDLGNMVPWANKIIQNSASLVLPGAFLRKQNHNLFDSLLYNSRQYITFKTLLVDTVNNSDYSTYLTPSQMLDDALDQMTASKTDSEPFFWSDMLPSKAAYITNTYSFANSLDVSIYPLSRVYDFATANYYGVLVYLTRNNVVTQLIKGTDYTISSDSPSLTITLDLLPNDQITIKEYNQTYGSYVPNTPTKLGLYPSTIPSVVLDSGYIQPTYFIVGHDGSYNKLYGDYNPTTGKLVDFRDQVLLEYEKRVYNNLKLSNAIPIQEYEVLPGFFRETDYTYNEFLEIYSESFLNWVGQNRINYKNHVYSKSNEYTYNYRDSGNKIDRAEIDIGYWRGIYQYFYDTSTPDVTPWEMLGYENEPTWWTGRYGPAPYTSQNTVLWTDLANGYDYNNGTPVTLEQYVRPELLQVLPVDSYGNLISPLTSIVGSYNQNLFSREWKVGDVGPAEFSYRRSSSWPFDLMRILALTKPANFFNLAVDLDHYKYNAEFNQYLFNDRSHLKMNDIHVYGSGTAVTSYINWIVDYEKQVGVDATQNISDLLGQLDVRLVYRLAGFSDKNMLKFYVEKSTANSQNSSLLIPDESYSVLLYDNQAFDRIVYSGVVIQITSNGYQIFGNSQTNAYFTIQDPKNSGNFESVQVEGLTVKVTKDYYDTTSTIPYGTEMYSVQEVATFLAGYGEYLTRQGLQQQEVENGIPVNWSQMVAEFLYWAQTGWEVGSITTLNPCATKLVIDKDSYIVQPLTLRQQNFVLNQNLYPIQTVDLSIVREGTAFSVAPLNQGDSLAYGQFNISNFEHGIVFDNTTLFGDIIYNLTTGLRQNRINVRGTKTAEWNGTIDAQGFILNQDNIQEWSKEVKYTKGSIVKYKNKYWTAIRIIQAKELFDEKDWKETDYNEIQKGLLPNGQTRSYESTIYYDVNKPNLENDADLLSFSLIGYRPRDYLALADLTDITQINVYKNMIKDKGTLNAASAFKGATLAQGGINYDIYENWAIKSGEFGGVLNSNFAEFKLNETLLTGNPSIVGLTNGDDIAGVQQEVQLYNLYNYGRPITDANILPTIPSGTPDKLFPSAGYVNFNDVKLASYYYSGLSTGRNQYGTLIPLDQLYVGDYVWLANYLEKWQVFTPVSIGTVVQAKNNLNNTVTVTFAKPHNLSKYEIFAIVNFNTAINGYQLVATVVDPYRVVINANVAPTITSMSGQGVAFKMHSRRVADATEINTIPLLDNEFTAAKVWVDVAEDGNWAVYRKTLNYAYADELNGASGEAETFGSAVAYTDSLGYLIGDADAGKVYRYKYNTLNDSYQLAQTITGTTSFGSSIVYSDNIILVSNPDDGEVYIYNLVTSATANNLVELQVLSGSTGFGTGVAISGDKNWIYVSTPATPNVKVFRKSSVTDEYELVETLTVAGVGSTDNFGQSLATDYYGDTLLIGTPDQDNGSYDNYGYAYVFGRTVQNLEASYTSIPYLPQDFTLAWTPDTTTVTVTATAASTNRLTCSDSSVLDVDSPIVFSGTIIDGSGISANQVYYVLAKPTGTTFTVSLERGGSAVALSNASGSMTGTQQDEPLFVSVNGTIVDDSTYSVKGSVLNMYSGATPALNAGDIVTVSGTNFVLTQTLDNGTTPRTGVQFGQSVATNNHANELLVGAPFELNDQNVEGAVHRYTNGGEKYGMIIGTVDCNITTPRVILLNGYSVTLPVGNASLSANAINAANITNVTATSIDGKLVISLIDVDLSIPSSKLSLSVLNSSTPAEMGIEVFTETQVILCPHTEGPTQFGSVIKLNNTTGSFVASAPTGTRWSATTFDFTDDENLDNDTVFDNNATQWIDNDANAGAVYMFDYIPAYNESINNPGKFVYAQSVNAQDTDYGAQPMYGSALDFNANNVVIGTPNFLPGATNGQVVIYKNAVGTSDWSVYRVSSPVVDIEGIQNAQLFSAETNNTLENLDYLDPLQGKLLGAVRQNIDVVSNIDPAGYNSVDNTQSGLVWGADKVGQIWFNTSNVRFLNYHQDDVVYNSKNWGKVFPGSDVAVYTWVASNVPPVLYTGPGTPYNTDLYTIQSVINAENTLSLIYYFWVRNSNVISENAEKTLSDSIIQSYIANPQSSGISYFAPLLPNVFGLYNSQEYINANDTVFHIGYKTGTNDDVSHSQYTLIRTDYADDFLPGLPNTTSLDTPESLYDRMLDSMCGVDETGEVVPNPWLPKAVQYGILARPRQSFFINRFKALQNYLQYANEILAQFPITEIRTPSFLNTEGTINPSNDQPFFVTQDYWSYKNWWATGYDDNTKSALQVPLYSDLAPLQVSAGTIVTVASNGAGNSETYRSNTDGSWTRIGLENGTIEFDSSLWDYETNRLGFGDNFFDTAPYDVYPSEETRYIIRSLNEEIYTDELQIYRNKSLILLFEYIQSETIESQNYLPWLNKTSFIDVAHTIRELVPLEVFKTDNQDFLEGYLNEVKPYHVVIKEFLFKYTGTDVYEGDITDFDLPATYNTELQQYITPQLVYSNPSSDNQYLPTDPIWQTAPYQQWFTNQGITFTGETNYNIATLESYVSLNSNTLYVNNAYGFPVTGIIKIDDEQIGYSGVDLSNSTLTGLTRGVNGTEVSIHLPGEKIYIDLPGVIVLDGGRAYAEPPKVIAYIDTSIYPEPRVPAQLEAVMGLDSVLSVNVINPGEGYVVTPTIVIDPSIVVNVSATQVSIVNNTIQLDVPLLQTGDLITYTVTDGSTPIGGLVPGQRYYIGVLETSPDTVIAIYNNYFNSIYDHDRVVLASSGTGTQVFSLGAVATGILDSTPVRENHITLRFDRTSYTSQVTEWNAGSYYGSFYAGTYFNSDTVSSSAITLQTTRPPIDSILASAQGVAFEILDVENDQVMTWSSRTRNVVQTYNDDTIRIEPSDGGSPVTPGKMGATDGFYVGMPVKFVGAGFGGITVDTTYYVKSLVDISGEATGFTISDTIDENGVPGTVVNLSAATVSPAGLLLYVANVTNTAVLTINYPGIRDVTATTSGTNSLTSPLIITGQNGTSGFYPGLPLVFTGNVFGGVLENETYYVTTVIDSETFTMSTNSNPTVITVTETSSSDNSITCSSTLDLTVGEKVMFSNMTISGTDVTEFGGLENGVVYYVNTILPGNTSFTVVEAIGDAVKTLTTQASGSGTGCFVTSQDDVVVLTSSAGSMTMNVALPVSPGQINGQQFTLYQSSEDDFLNVSGPVTNLLTRAVTASIATAASEYRICFDSYSAGTTNMYTGLPFVLSDSIGGLTAGTTYEVDEIGTTTFVVTNASTTGNLLTTTDTTILYEGMPVVFTNESLGGISVNTTYYVHTISSTTQFSVSTSDGGSEVTIISTQNGTMNATGSQYITIANTVTDEVKAVTLTQYMTSANYPAFDIGYVLGGYVITSITDAGEGLAVDNVITIDGADLGGTSGTNDLTITITSVNSSGGFVSGTRSGTPAGTVTQYYFKVVSEDKVAVFSNPNMTIPVSGLNFPYTGVTSTTASAATASNDRFTVSSSTNFAVNDAVVFTGTVFGGIELGQTYYIKSKPSSTTVTLSETIGGSTFNVSSDASGTMTMAKFGDFALLPEPFYFNSSIVKYNNRVYQCIISNNDPEFIFGKWELLDSGDARLNALDRITGYYQPTINMPGLDLTQLVSGISYPNSTYLGNAFAPDDEFAIDTLLQDQPFYPTEIDIKSIVWDGFTYLAGSDTPNYSAILLSEDGETWGIDKIANQPINITSMLFADDKYVITTNNSATPILTSDDGVTWTVVESVIGSNSLSSSVYNDGLYLAAGENIVASTDLETWDEVYNFGSSLENYFYGITYASTAGFTGYVAVGHGQVAESIVTITNVPVIRTSTDGITWNSVNFTATSYGFNSVASNDQNIVAVGDNGIIYTSFNTLVWFSQTSGTTENLTFVDWLNGQFIAVGNNGKILTAPIDAGTWTTQTSGTTENLNSVTWSEELEQYIVVGDNNTILQSVDGITWESTALFTTDPTVYDVQGAAFTSGYGPEEMVPGVVTDSMMMTVVTRPGTNWPETEYQHVGYNVVSTELTPTSADQVIYSFAGLVQTPAQLAVFVIDKTSGLSTSLYDTNDYSVNWVNKTVTLNDPINYVSIGNSDSLRIDVYEVGNGDQLVKANTETDPIRDNDVTGFNEIYLNCNYSGLIYSGSGVIRPSTVPAEAIALSSDEVTDTITVDDVSNFVLNSPITFSGAVFGGIVEDQVYYVKTISYISNRISLSETYTSETGTAGPTFPLETYDGPDTMTAIIEVGTGAVWTDPIVYHNGTKLVLGATGSITRTRASTNTITCNTTGALVVNTPIIFSDTIFGGVIEPQQVYYIKQIYDSNEFTISETLGGSTLELTDATGGAIYITNDYAFGLASNGISAKMMFSAQYDATVDYITYTVFGETYPIQYGYTIPEVQLFEGDGATVGFNLVNYVSGDNPQNAIVEIDGLRLTSSQYEINPISNQLVLYMTPPASGSTIAVTSYNLTDRQYFNTTFGTSGTGVATITVTSTTHQAGLFDEDSPSVETFDQDTPSVVAYDEQLDWLTTSDTSGLAVDDAIIFSDVIGGIVTGVTYYVVEILNSTDFVVSTEVGGTPTVVTTDSGTMIGVLNGQTVANITNIDNAITAPLAITSVTDTSSTGNVITCSSTSGFVEGQTAIFKSAEGVPGFGGIETDGTVYYVRSIDSLTEFTIEDQFGNEIALTTDSGNMYVYVGGTPAVRVTTGINHNLSENAIVRLDGIVGSTELNNNVYYAKVINLTQVDLYETAYDPAYGAINTPVTAVSAYVNGGYIWLAGLFTLETTRATESTTGDNTITVISTDELVVDTPVIFTSSYEDLGTDILGGIIAGETYYVKEIVDETTFTISETRGGEEFALSNDTATITVTQWEQVNVDRLWVTVNGYRVPSSKLRINTYNDVSILTTIESGDNVIITSMMPTATPNEETYLLNVSTTNQASVYRANTSSRTWLTQPLSYTDETIYVNDVSRLVTVYEKTFTTPSYTPGTNTFTEGIAVDKNSITQITVFNETTGTTVSADYYSLELQDTAPVLVFTGSVQPGDEVTITVVLGRVIYVAGEAIRFSVANLEGNYLTGLQRGINGTGEQNYIPKYSEVYGLLSENRMSDVQYELTWNSAVYNTTDGDPLQISTTAPARFLRVDAN